jgi:hypothetical protein
MSLPPPKFSEFEDRHLSLLEIRSGIQQVIFRIKELEDLNVLSITRPQSPEIVVIKKGVEQTLAEIFGQNTPRFTRFRAAAALEPQPLPASTANWMQKQTSKRTAASQDIQELRRDIEVRRKRSVDILNQVIELLSAEASR